MNTMRDTQAVFKSFDNELNRDRSYWGSG
jgi:hypothetical protein